VELVKENQAPYEIHVKEGSFLSENHKRAHHALDEEKIYVHVPIDLVSEFKTYEKFPEGIGFEEERLFLRLDANISAVQKKVNKIKDVSAAAKAKLKELFLNNKEVIAKKWMCKNFFDVRTFGAVMSTGDLTCGQVRGPIQMGFAKSIEPIIGLEIAMSRTAAVSVDKPDDKGLGARKAIIPYGLYRVHGYISAPLAQQTGFTEDDLELFWKALENMFDHDRSAARGEMAAQKLFVFKHNSKLGNAQAHKLFDLIQVERKQETLDPARSFADYTVTVGTAPDKVELIEKF
jgi:CRISPR-associated protein Csd2